MKKLFLLIIISLTVAPLASASFENASHICPTGSYLSGDGTCEDSGTIVTNGGGLTSYTETDPVYSGDPASGITAGDITNWDTAHGWGDHSTEGYITDGNTNWNNSYGFITAGQVPANETDPQVGTITTAGRWCTTNGSAINCAENAPLTSESDPDYNGDPASGITAADITNWDTAHGWGDHSTEGYITDGNTNWNNSYGFITDANDTVQWSEISGIVGTTSTTVAAGNHTHSGYITDDSSGIALSCTCSVAGDSGNICFDGTNFKGCKSGTWYNLDTLN